MGIFSTSSPKSAMPISIDTGIDVLNKMIDGFLVFAVVAAMRLVALEVYHCCTKGSFSKEKLQPLLKKMGNEGAYWGVIVGLYVGLVYGLGMTHLVVGWLTAMVGGALTGGLVSAACSKGRDKIVEDAVTGGAIATAVELVQYIT